MAVKAAESLQQLGLQQQLLEQSALEQPPSDRITTGKPALVLARNTDALLPAASQAETATSTMLLSTDRSPRSVDAAAPPVQRCVSDTGQVTVSASVFIKDFFCCGYFDPENIFLDNENK